MTFASPTLGWALGTAPCAAGRCRTLVHTDSAGWAWTTLTPPPGEVTGIRFATSAAGYAFGPGRVDVTADGGTSWRPAAIGVSDTVLTVTIGAGQPFVAVKAGTATNPSVSLLRAPAGSDTFTPLPTAVLTGTATARVSFDGRFGYLSGESPAPGMLVTADGGVTWSQRSLPCSAVQQAAARVAPFGGGELYVVCSAPGAGGQFDKGLFFSVDGGATFHADSSAVPDMEGRLEDLASVGSSYSLVMATASARSSLFRLGGETWAPVARPNHGGIPWHDLGFTTEYQGVAILGDQPGPGDEGAGLYMTRDRGQHWALVDFGMSVLPPRCRAPQLTLGESKDGGGVGLGNVVTELVFTNHAATPCTLDGYPGLTLVNRSGQALTNAITRSTDSYFFTDRQAEPVVLAAAGGTASFFVSYGDNPIGNATSCPSAVQARVYPPGDTQSTAGPVDIQPCGNLLISPVVAGS